MILLGVESASDRILKQMNKGFTTAEVRQAFQILRTFPFYYHAYFIYGNVGESEGEMLAIPGFARELSVHSISLSRLRVDKYTPMRRLIEKTPGYRISDNGYVYSEAFDKYRLRKIRNRIRDGFGLRPAQVLTMLSTVRRTDVNPVACTSTVAGSVTSGKANAPRSSEVAVIVRPFCWATMSAPATRTPPAACTVPVSPCADTTLTRINTNSCIMVSILPSVFQLVAYFCLLPSDFCLAHPCRRSNSRINATRSTTPCSGNAL